MDNLVEFGIKIELDDELMAEHFRNLCIPKIVDNSVGVDSVEFKIKTEELIVKDEVEDPAYELTIIEENSTEGKDSVEFKIKSEEFIIKEEDDEPTNKLTTNESKFTFKQDDLEAMDDVEGSVEFKIKSEELIIKDELDEPTYELTTTQERNYVFEDQRQFVIINSDLGPPYIIDRFANIAIKVDMSISTKEDLNRMVMYYVELVRLTTSKMNRKDQEPAVNKSRIILPSNSTHHKCNNCGKSFRGMGKLERHMLIHEGVKAYECQLCKKTFIFKSTLKWHILIDEGKKAYKCQQCNKAFTFKWNLKQHMVIHEGTKAYECQLCKKSFRLKSTLKRHMHIHKDKKGYECQQCKKAFTSTIGFKQHMLFHEGKRAYECQLCKKSFFTNSQLKRHILIHKGKKGTVEEEHDSEGSVEFKIKSEEFIIKDEVDDPTYELTTEEKNGVSEDRRQFVIIKWDSGPPYIIDRFANIVIKVDASISTKEDLNRMMTSYVELVRLTTSEIKGRTSFKPISYNIAF